MPTAPDLSPAQHSALLAAAEQAAWQAYAPYSGFRVGAALLLGGGSTVTAANVESASYGLTICAERSAVARAVAEQGPGMRIVAVAVTNLNRAASPPCGACRQVLAEFMPPTGLVLFPYDGGIRTFTLADIFPLGFALAHVR